MYRNKSNLYNKKIVLLSCVVFLSCFSFCKKKQNTTNTSTEFSASFTAGGKTYNIIPHLDLCKAENHSCSYFGPNGQISNTTQSGLTLQLFTHYSNPANEGIILQLKIYGDVVGRYQNPTTFCNDFRMYTSMIQSADRTGLAILKDGSYFEIAKKEKKTISGNFRFKIDYDASFLKDSIVTGEFKNLTYNE